MRFAARARHVREACAGDGAAGQAREADDVGTWRRRDRGADLRFGDRRSGAVFLVEAGWTAFRPDAEKISVGETDVTGRITKIGDAGVAHGAL